MIGRLSTLAMSLTAAFAAVARAQDRPVLLPTRDVAIIYRLPGDSMGNSAQKMQATYADGSKKIRYDFFRFTEAKTPFASWIYDRVAERLIVVMPERFWPVIVTVAPSVALSGEKEVSTTGGIVV